MLAIADTGGGLSYSLADAMEDTSAARVTKPSESKPASSNPTDFYWSGSEKVFLRQVDGELAVGFSSPATRLQSVDSLLSAGGALENASVLRDLNNRSVVFRMPEGAVDLPTGLADRDDIAWVGPVFVTADTGHELVVTNELIVALKPDVDEVGFFADYKSVLSNPSGMFPNQWLVTAIEGGGRAVLDLSNRLALDDRVEWAAPNSLQEVRVEHHDPPNDALYGNQWHLNNTGQTQARVDADSDVAEAWDTSIGNNHVVVAVLDTGGGEHSQRA
jgi:hypothetical protein